MDVSETCNIPFIYAFAKGKPSTFFSSTNDVRHKPRSPVVEKNGKGAAGSINDKSINLSYQEFERKHRLEVLFC